MHLLLRYVQMNKQEPGPSACNAMQSSQMCSWSGRLHQGWSRIYIVMQL